MKAFGTYTSRTRDKSFWQCMKLEMLILGLGPSINDVWYGELVTLVFLITVVNWTALWGQWNFLFMIHTPSPMAPSQKAMAAMQQKQKVMLTQTSVPPFFLGYDSWSLKCLTHLLSDSSLPLWESIAINCKQDLRVFSGRNMQRWAIQKSM